MRTHKFEFNVLAGHKTPGNERGIALLIVLLALLLLSAIGMGMMYMSDTETSINGNYRDTQLAFFAMRSGLEEARDRMRSNSVSPLTLPTAMPGAANSILYLINPAGAQVCYQSAANQEIPLSLVPGGPYASCSAAQAAGRDASPVYIVTSLAVTPRGSRRMGQYEVAGLTFSPPAAALGLDGPAATFAPRPSSNNYFINGNDSGASGYTSSGGPGTCVSSGPAQVPAISTGDAAGDTAITNTLTANPNRSTRYTGAGGTPSVVNAGSGAGGTGQFGGAWSSPAQLDNLVNTLANVADVTYSCGIGAACSPGGPVGTNASPQITYVDGDFNFGNGSGAGILVVTGTLSFTGNASFNGLILVIGQGAVSESGGGNGGFNGTIFIAKTHSSTYPYFELASLASPRMCWNGGGQS